MNNKIESKTTILFVGAIGAKQVPLRHGVASLDGPDFGAIGGVHTFFQNVPSMAPTRSRRCVPFGRARKIEKEIL